MSRWNTNSDLDLAPCRCGCGQKAPRARNSYPASGIVRGQQLPFLPGHHARMRGVTSDKFYAYRYVVDHPRGLQVGVHVLVAEQVLGKYLPPNAVVHHVNGNKRDNRPANLVICQDKAYHNFLHMLMRVRAAGGNPHTERVCCTCKRLRPKALMAKSNGKRERSECKACGSARNCQRERLRKEVASGTLVSA